MTRTTAAVLACLLCLLAVPAAAAGGTVTPQSADPRDQGAEPMPESPQENTTLADHLEEAMPDHPMPEADLEAMQRRTREAVTPGEHHAALAYFLGTWDVEIALVMPGAPEGTWSGTSTFEWVIDGRWMGERLRGEMFGAPYESFAIRGYDNFARNHVVVTVSSADTAMNLARSVVADPEGRITTFYGTLDEYTTGELHKPFRATSKIVDDDHHVLEIWDLGMGETGAKVLEFRYRRRGEEASAEGR